MLRNRHFSIFTKSLCLCGRPQILVDSYSHYTNVYMHTHTHKDFRFSQSKISLPRFQAPEIDNGESPEFYVDFCYFFFFSGFVLGEILDHTCSPA